jgi:hypothetical protein
MMTIVPQCLRPARFFGEPPDSHTMRVFAAWELVEEKGVHLRVSGCGVSKLSSGRLLFTPSPMDGAEAWRLQDGYAVSDVIAQRPVHDGMRRNAFSFPASLSIWCL